MDKMSYLQVPGWENTNDRFRGSCCSNIGSQMKLDDNCNDKYTAAIELSNKCRAFYKSRLEVAKSMKSRWRDTSTGQDSNYDDSDTSSLSTSSSSLSSNVDDNDKTNRNRQQRHRIDQAMEKLRTEMVSLMDQDLSLMKQLLTLNETIEEIKWQSQYYSYSTSWASFSASKNLESSLSVSDTEMYDSEDDLMKAQHTSYRSVHAGQVTGPVWHNKRNIPRSSKELQKISADSVSIKIENVNSTRPRTNLTTSGTTNNVSTVLAEDSSVASVPKSRFVNDHQKTPYSQVHHERGENSFDSGIHEAVSGDELHCMC